MKQLILLSALISLGSCKTATTLSNAYSKALNHADIEKPYREGGLIVLEANVHELYPVDEFRRKCPVAIVVWDGANASINAKVKCYPDSIKVLEGVGKNLVDLMLPHDYGK